MPWCFLKSSCEDVSVYIWERNYWISLSLFGNCNSQLISPWTLSHTKRAISYFVTMFSKSCLLQRRQKASIWGKGLNLSHLQTHFDVSAADEFWKHCGKKEKDLIVFYGDVPYFLWDVFSVNRCSFVVCGKGLTISEQLYFSHFIALSNPPRWLSCRLSSFVREVTCLIPGHVIAEALKNGNNGFPSFAPRIVGLSLWTDSMVSG